MTLMLRRLCSQVLRCRFGSSLKRQSINKNTLRLPTDIWALTVSSGCLKAFDLPGGRRGRAGW
jgi:hypothetical protein